MKAAIVFDSAGTLLKVYRVAIDVASKKLVENVISTNMITKGQGCVLIALQAEPRDLMNGSVPSELVSDYLSRNSIGFDVICRGLKCTGERISKAVAKDRSASMDDMKQAIEAVKLKCKDIYYLNIGLIVDVPHNAIPYVLATGGKPFPGVREMLERLRGSGIDVYVASGDNRKSLTALAYNLDLPEPNVYDAVSPSGKADLVKRLKTEYDTVFMVGDGINDYLAFQAADVSVLSLQQGGMRPNELYEASDVTVNDILEVEAVVRESLHTCIRNNCRKT